MANAEEMDKSNGVVVELKDDSDKNRETLRLIEIETTSTGNRNPEEATLYAVLHRLFAAIFFSNPYATETKTPLFRRIKASINENGPALREASRNSTRNLLRWTRQGSPFRAILVISVGSTVLLALTGLMVFMLFFLAATINAIIISLFMSMAAAGGFLAIFFACVTAIYIWALSVAVFVISCATITTIIAVLTFTGWIGFFWTVWLATKKSVDLAKHSLSMTGSAISAYSVTRQAYHHEPEKTSTKPNYYGGITCCGFGSYVKTDY